MDFRHIRSADSSVYVISVEALIQSEPPFHDYSRVRGIRVIPRGSPDNPETEFPVELDDCGIAAAHVRDHAGEAVIPGVSELPRFQQIAETSASEFRKNACRADV